MLLFQVREFWYRPHERSLESAPECTEEGGLPGAGVVAWVHVESRDVARPGRSARRAAKNIKWLVRKVGVQDVVLHSFAHLADERATPEESARIIEDIARRLREVGLRVTHTPWGYYNEFRLHVEGPGIAKIYREF